MSFTTDHQQKFTDLDFHVENQDQLRRQANGGNSILFSYPADEENVYVAEAKKRYGDRASFIDVGKQFVEFIEGEGWDSFKEYYAEFKDTPHLVFRSDDPSKDLFDLIISRIVSACEDGKVPFLVRTGCLFGTGIENVNVMEHKSVISLKRPLVIFYPSRTEGDNLYFLNFKPASKYRCTLVT
jgi:hypothetical protein